MMSKGRNQDKLDRYAKEVYSVGFKRRIIERLRMGLSTETEICKQHDISLNLLREWNRWYERHFQRLNQISDPMASTKSTDPEKLIAELEKKLRKSEKSLKKAELNAEVWKILVRIASEELGIDIEKKFGSGQLPG